MKTSCLITSVAGPRVTEEVPAAVNALEAVTVPGVGQGQTDHWMHMTAGMSGT